MKSKILIGSLISLFLTSCATSYYPKATGGSKADATVRVTYGYSNATNPNNWDEEWEGIDKDANIRCQNWGYSSAIRFDRGERYCTVVNGYGGCNYWNETLYYQCID